MSVADTFFRSGDSTTTEVLNRNKKYSPSRIAVRIILRRRRLLNCFLGPLKLSNDGNGVVAIRDIRYYGRNKICGPKQEHTVRS